MARVAPQPGHSQPVRRRAVILWQDGGREVVNYLDLGVPEEVASEDACMIEHLVSPEVSVELLRLTSFLRSQHPVAAQFRDDHGITSLIYCDDISLEGMPAVPSVGSTDWYSQVQCFAESDVHPSQGESVTGPTVTFSWPATNNLPDGVFYQVNAYSSVDKYTGLAAQGRTRDNSLALQFSPDKAGDIVWYVVLADANGTFLDHGRCSSFPASLLTVNPPSGIKGVHFLYQP